MATYHFRRRIVTETWAADGTYSTNTKVITGSTSDSVKEGTTIVETQTVIPELIPVATVLKTLCMRAGFEEANIDVSEVTGSLIGLTITDDDYKSVTEMMMRGYFLNVAVDGDSIKFTSRVQEVFKRIPYTDLDAIEPSDSSGSGEASAPIQITRIPDAQLPKIMQVNYLDPSQDFQKCTQYVVRIWGKSDITHDINFNIIMDADTAAQIAEKALYEMWSQRQHYKFVTGMQHADVKVNQVVEVEGKPYRFWEPLTDYVQGTYCRPTQPVGRFVPDKSFDRKAAMRTYDGLHVTEGPRIDFKQEYPSTYVGVIEGTVSGIAASQYANYHVVIYSYTDSKYYQYTSNINSDGTWGNTLAAGEEMIAYGGTKYVELVIIKTSTAIAKNWSGGGIVRSYDDWLDRTFTYDQAATVIGFTSSLDQTTAEYYMSGLLKMIDPTSGGVPFSVNAISGMWNVMYQRTGAQCWVGYALAFFLSKFPTSSLATTVTTTLQRVLNNTMSYYVTSSSSPQYHTFLGGQGKYDNVTWVFNSAYRIPWASTEHNIDAYFFFELAGRVLGNAAYTTTANEVKQALLTRFWSDDLQRFYQGMGPTEADTANALDINSWGSIFLRSVGETEKADLALAQVQSFKCIDGNAVGYRAYTPEGGYPDAVNTVWSEGTLGVIAAKMFAGRRDEAVAEYNRLLRTWTAKGMKYVTTTDTAYEMSAWYAAISIAWTFMAEKPEGFWNMNHVMFDPADVQSDYVFKCIKTGNSGTFEPAWNSDASHIIDGSALWVADELPIHKIMVTKKDTGVNGAIEWEGISYDVAVYDSTRAGSSGIPTVPIYTAPGTSLPLFRDIPIISETHNSPGFYAMATGASSSWSTGVVYKSADKGATWNTAFTITSPTTMGLTKQRLGSGPYTIWDTVNTVDVELVKGTLSSATDALVLQGANLCLIGDEILQFANAELIAPNTYRLSRLLRGRRGTEQYRLSHRSGEHFTMLSNATRVTRPISEVNVPLLYKVVPPGSYLEDQPAFEFTWTGEGLKPFSPVLPTCDKAVNGDITITWVRRSRIGQELVSPNDMPLGESYERYYVDIYDDYMSGKIVKTYTVNNATTFTYTKAMQVADLGDVATGSTAFRVSQVSDLIGRGYPTVIQVPN